PMRILDVLALLIPNAPSFFLFQGAGAHPALHSFPTRRSSDLIQPLAGPHPRSPRSRVRARESRGRSVRRVGWIRRVGQAERPALDRKSTRLNSSHDQNSYAVFCLKKKNNKTQHHLGVASQERT